MISSRLATLVELDTVYGVRDLYLLLEVLAVDGANRRLAEKAAATARRRAAARG